MASGKPVIASRLGGIPELIEDGVSGLLVPHADPAKLAAAIERLAKNPSLRASLSTAARARAVERFDLRPSVRAHVELCEEVARERGRRRLGARRDVLAAQGA